MIEFNSLSTGVSIPLPEDFVLDPQLFRRACAQFATGIAIATVFDPQGAPHGMTVNSFTSVSLTPPLVLICVDYSANLLPFFRAASHYAINVLAEHQQALSQRFAQRGCDRFDGVEWRPGATGVPLLPAALAHLECATTQVIEAGDHAIFLAQVIHAACFPGRPLLYFDSSYRQLK
jgi:flavin reductase (DIM6/NTAB) family NADH-FMN oxidoreductase RutF